VPWIVRLGQCVDPESVAGAFQGEDVGVRDDTDDHRGGGGGGGGDGLVGEEA
jgi:hypothetical protein